MTWMNFHRNSEQWASRAFSQSLEGNRDAARLSYKEAAIWEQKALECIPADKPRTIGIIATSSAALWIKSEEFKQAEDCCLDLISKRILDDYFREQIKIILQSAWIGQAKKKSGVSFLPGQVIVSIKGGEVITGGAPLDLVVEKVQTIQSMFYRTIENLQGIPFRARGGPSREIQESCRPWLFQEPPGSYQFSIAIQEPRQKDFFQPSIDPHLVASRFLQIVSAAITDERALEQLVPDQAYKQTFLKLSRNLAPTGKKFTRIDLRSNIESTPVVLTTESRNFVSKNISKKLAKTDESHAEVRLHGILRAVHLDKNWLEVLEDGILKQVSGLADTVDDVIGPMVNRLVNIRALNKGASLQFLDIELD